MAHCDAKKINNNLDYFLTLKWANFISWVEKIREHSIQMYKTYYSYLPPYYPLKWPTVTHTKKHNNLDYLLKLKWANFISWVGKIRENSIQMYKKYSSYLPPYDPLKLPTVTQKKINNNSKYFLTLKWANFISWVGKIRENSITLFIILSPELEK